MNALIVAIPDWFVVAILLGLSVFTMGVIMERGFHLYFSLKHAGENIADTLRRSRELSGPDRIAFLLEQKDSLAHIFARILAAGARGQALGSAYEEESRHFAERVRRRLPALGTISTVAPLLGLLGTVTGMIKSFSAFDGAEAAVSRGMLSAGIDEALITTCLGLMIAIPALIAYNSYAARANALLDHLEFYGDRFLKEEDR